MWVNPFLTDRARDSHNMFELPIGQIQFLKFLNPQDVAMKIFKVMEPWVKGKLVAINQDTDP